MMAKLIIFVCVSNTCRSPMCEYMMRKKLQASGVTDFTVVSRSVSVDYEPEGSPANEQGVLVMKNEFGIDTSGHRSKLLSAEDVSMAHMIIPVKKELGMYINQLFPQSSGKLKFLSRDIMDPWRQPYPVYQSCAHMIESLLSDVLADIKDSMKDL